MGPGSLAGLDARYVPRFVGGVEVAGAAVTPDSAAASRGVMYSPSQVWGGFAPGAIAPGLVPNSVGMLAHERFRVYRNAGVPFITLVRTNGTLLAPTEPQSGQTIGEVGGGGYDTAVGQVQFGAGVRIQASETWAATARGSFVRVTGIVPGTTATLQVLNIEAPAAATADVNTALATLRIRAGTTAQLRNPANTATALEWNATGLGVFGAAPVARSAAIANAAGGATVDAEARTALNALLTYLRTFGLITP
jgi:hypothetical protein